MVGGLGKTFYINTYNRAVSNMADDAILRDLLAAERDILPDHWYGAETHGG